MNAEQLKESMRGQTRVFKEQLSEALEYLSRLAEHGDSNVRDAAIRAREKVSNAASHAESIFETAFVAADAHPARSAEPTAAGRAAPRPAYAPPAAEPTRMSGVPATPPGGPLAVAGPAVTHDDVGHIDTLTGQAHAAPAASGVPSHDLGTEEPPLEKGDEDAARDVKRESGEAARR